MNTLTVAKRFCGPSASANGGYFVGLLAGLADHTLSVRLVRPPPLDTAMQVEQSPEGILVSSSGELIGEARTVALDLAVPAPPTYIEALDASLHYMGFNHHPAPNCFVCGPKRVRGDGLRIFAGALADRQLVAAPWVPHASLDRGDGKVRPEFMWAAMDCPGYFAAQTDGRSMLLGEFTAHVDRCVHVDEPCVVIGWQIAASGRKHETGTALFDDGGELCGRARAVWIEPRVV